MIIDIHNYSIGQHKRNCCTHSTSYSSVQLTKNYRNSHIYQRHKRIHNCTKFMLILCTLNLNPDILNQCNRCWQYKKQCHIIRLPVFFTCPIYFSQLKTGITTDTRLSLVKNSEKQSFCTFTPEHYSYRLQNNSHI